MVSSLLKKSVIIASSLLISLSLSSAFAKPVNLYDEPKDGAKTVGTIDSNSPMVPIFTSKDGTWIKVGNPTNGNVGWAKVADLNTNNGTGFSFSQQTIDTASGPKTTIQFGVPQPMTSDQIKEMQKRQAEVQASIQKMMQDMYRDISNAYSTPNGVPIFMPIIVMPTSNIPPRTIPMQPTQPLTHQLKKTPPAVDQTPKPAARTKIPTNKDLSLPSEPE